MLLVTDSYNTVTHHRWVYWIWGALIRLFFQIQCNMAIAPAWRLAMCFSHCSIDSACDEKHKRQVNVKDVRVWVTDRPLTRSIAATRRRRWFKMIAFGLMDISPTGFGTPERTAIPWGFWQIMWAFVWRGAGSLSGAQSSTSRASRWRDVSYGLQPLQCLWFAVELQFRAGVLRNKTGLHLRPDVTAGGLRRHEVSRDLPRTPPQPSVTWRTGLSCLFGNQ